MSLSRRAKKAPSFVNAMARKKGLKIQILSGAYGVTMPNGTLLGFKTRAELERYVRGY